MSDQYRPQPYDDGPRTTVDPHLLPHLLPTILVWATLGISTTVLLEATLSFLGVGVQPPTPSWGNIIFESQTYFTEAPWLVFFPGAAIVLLSLALAYVLRGEPMQLAVSRAIAGVHAALEATLAADVEELDVLSAAPAAQLPPGRFRGQRLA